MYELRSRKWIYKTIAFTKKEDEFDFDSVIAKFEADFISKKFIYENPKFYSRAKLLWY